MSFWEDMLINGAITMIIQSIKSEKSKIKFKKAFLKIRNIINMEFAHDPDFNS